MTTTAAERTSAAPDARARRLCYLGPAVGLLSPPADHPAEHGLHGLEGRGAGRT